MGLSDVSENQIKAERAKKIYEDELKSLVKISEKEGKEDNVSNSATTVLDYVGSNFRGNGVNNVVVRGKTLVNKNGKNVKVYSSTNPNRKQEVMIYSMNLDENTKVGISKIDDNIIYTLDSPETGKIDLAIANRDNVQVYNYSTEKGGPYHTKNLMPDLNRTSDIASLEGATVRDIVANHIKDHGIMGTYADRIMAGFDEILSLDEQREITPLSQEEISRMEMLKKGEEKDKEIQRLNEVIKAMNIEFKSVEENLNSSEVEKDRLQKENDALKEENEGLKTENAEQKVQIGKLQTMLGKTLDFASKVRDSIAGKLFFKKPLQELNVNGQSLPEGEDR